MSKLNLKSLGSLEAVLGNKELTSAQPEPTQSQIDAAEAAKAKNEEAVENAEDDEEIELEKPKLDPDQVFAEMIEEIEAKKKAKGEAT